MIGPHHTNELLQAASWTALLEELVNTDSAPGDHAGIDAVHARLAATVEGLGFTVTKVPTDGGPDVLKAHRPGARPQAAKVLMLGHVDTVFPAGTANVRPFTIAEDRAFGPGVADMKGGLVVALAALSELEADALAGLDITLLFNGDEESGSLSSRPVIESEALHQDAALVFESARRSGAIVTSRRGVARYRLDITGSAAHSGTNPDAGANALEALAHTITGIQDLGRKVTGASVSAVMAEGGNRPNIIPDAASVHVDARFDDADAEKAVRDGLETLADAKTVDGTSTRLTWYAGRPAFGRPCNELADAYVGSGRKAGVSIQTTSTGGASDANITAALGIPTLDGLGPVGGGAHTVDEYVEVPSLMERASICADLLTSLAVERS